MYRALIVKMATLENYFSKQIVSTEHITQSHQLAQPYQCRPHHTPQTFSLLVSPSHRCPCLTPGEPVDYQQFTLVSLAEKCNGLMPSVGLCSAEAFQCQPLTAPANISCATLITDVCYFKNSSSCIKYLIHLSMRSKVSNFSTLLVAALTCHTHLPLNYRLAHSSRLFQDKKIQSKR